MYYVLKICITTVLVVLISEISKRSSLVAALLASIPLVSVLAMIWLYVETHDVVKISSLANGIFWLVLPSLVLFIALPLLLKSGLHFYLSLFVSIGLTAASYFALLKGLKYFNIEF